MTSHSLDVSAGFPEGDAFLEFWANIPKDDGLLIPRRKAFNPSLITSLLPHTFVGQIISETEYIIRLRGTWLEQFVGPADKSVNVYDSYSGSVRDNYMRFINTLITTPCAGVCERTFVSDNGHEHPFPTLFTPFCDDNGEARFMIGVAVMGGYKSWEITEMDSIFANTRFKAFRFIDLGHGAPDPIY